MSLKGLIIGGSIVLGLGAIYNASQKKKKYPPVFIKKNLPKNYNAMTVPPFGIFVKESEKDNAPLLMHELEHWKQYQDKGLVKFLSDYSTEKKQFGYDKMPMEKQARANESDYCKENYTDCVRTGKAKTVFNPKFRT